MITTKEGFTKEGDLKLDDNIRIIMLDMPIGYRAFTLPGDGFYTIYLNSRYCREQNKLSLEHELRHIKNGDYDKDKSVDLIEIFAHNANTDYD